MTVHRASYVSILLAPPKSNDSGFQTKAETLPVLQEAHCRERHATRQLHGGANACKEDGHNVFTGWGLLQVPSFQLWSLPS